MMEPGQKMKKGRESINDNTQKHIFPLGGESHTSFHAFFVPSTLFLMDAFEN